MTRAFHLVFCFGLAACAAPEPAWQPLAAPSFGRDQAVAEQAFCGVIFEGLSQAADNADDRRVLTALRDSTIERLERLDAGPADPDFRSGIAHAGVYVRGATDMQMIAAGSRCVQIVMNGGKS